MFKTLRMKLMLGFLPLLAILIGLGLWAIAMFYGLGGNIDVILRENYRSVLAVERMKEALERMDSGLMFAFSGRAQQAREQFDKSKQEFDRQLGVEQHNITVPGEQELVNELTAEYRGYLDLAADYFDLHNATTADRADVYFRRLLPKFENLRKLEDRVLLLNQRNMEQMNETSASVRSQLDPLDDRGAAGCRGPGHRLVAGPDTADPGAYRRRDGRSASRFTGQPRPGCARDHAGRARRARPGVQHDGQDNSRVP